MEKTISRNVKRKQYYHEFYCDKCNKFLGKTAEYDDGWYPRLGEYEQKFNVNGYGWCELELNLCDKCKAEKNLLILISLKELGFDVNILGEDNEHTN